MNKKGLFDSIFILTMLVFFVPQLHIISNVDIITNTTNQLTDITLAADNLVADVMSDVTFKSCKVSSKGDYDTELETYQDDFETIINERSNIHCNLITESSELSGSRYYGSIVSLCRSKNSLVDFNISRRLIFDKTISFTDLGGGSCYVEIQDNLASGFQQVKVTQ